MKIAIEDDEGRRMSLDTALTIIPPGHAVLICPSNEYILADWQKAQINAELIALGIRGFVTQVAVHVWAIADDAQRATEEQDARSS